jgi:hypothetical protein
MIDDLKKAMDDMCRGYEAKITEYSNILII